jgi:histidine phosphotransferase ChpT
MDGVAKGPEMALVSESVANANARIRFFRVAFGQTSQDQRIGASEVASILNDLTRGGRIAISWSSAPDLLRRETKLAFLLILCLETALSYGGQISVDRRENRWHIQGSGARIRVEPELWEMLSNPAAGAEIGPAQVQFLLAPEEVARQHRRLTAEISATAIKLMF